MLRPSLPFHLRQEFLPRLLISQIPASLERLEFRFIASPPGFHPPLPLRPPGRAVFQAYLEMEYPVSRSDPSLFYHKDVWSVPCNDIILPRSAPFNDPLLDSPRCHLFSDNANAPLCAAFTCFTRKLIYCPKRNRVHFKNLLL